MGDSIDDAEFRLGSASLYPTDRPLVQLDALCYPPYINYIHFNLFLLSSHQT